MYFYCETRGRSKESKSSKAVLGEDIISYLFNSVNSLQIKNKECGAKFNKLNFGAAAQKKCRSRGEFQTTKKAEPLLKEAFGSAIGYFLVYCFKVDLEAVVVSFKSYEAKTRVHKS